MKPFIYDMSENGGPNNSPKSKHIQVKLKVIYYFFLPLMNLFSTPEVIILL